jgi:general stress protein YciG
MEHEAATRSDTERRGGAAERRPRGFAAMTLERRREIASQGGRAAHERGQAHEFTSDEARLAGKKGGAAVSTDRAHMVEIGKRGGEAVAADRDHMVQIGRKGGEAVAADRDHMAEIGRKGGEARGSGSDGR